jgi:UbiD family decarboxylase
VSSAPLAGKPEIYYLGMGCNSAEEMDARWKKALAEPINPITIANAKCQDVVILGDELDKEGNGLDRFPVPISTPGFDNGPYTTCSHWITADLDTGIQNIGNYRGEIKARRRVGVFPSGLGQDVYLRWKKAQERGVHLPAALVVGAPPIVSYVSVQKIPYGVDEMGVAGGLAGEPIPMVKCKTVDIMVPADAEIVIEGYLNTEYIEPEGPFGESHGYMHPRQLNPFMDVTAITHRKDAIYTSWLSQLTPSESSVIRKIGHDRLMLVHLRDECRITSVLRVEMHEPLTNTYKLVIIQMRRPNEAEVWRALHAACSFHPGIGKIVVAVDEDIDPSNEAAVFWAMCYRMKPHKTCRSFPAWKRAMLHRFSTSTRPKERTWCPTPRTNRRCSATRFSRSRSRRCRCRSANLWKTPRRFGKSSSCPSSGRRCHGSAIRSVSGAKSSIARLSSPCKGVTSRPARSSRLLGSKCAESITANRQDSL